MSNKWLLAKKHAPSNLMMSSEEKMDKTRAEEDLHHWTTLEYHRTPLI
jgi:hypothetical protein